MLLPLGVMWARSSRADTQPQCNNQVSQQLMYRVYGKNIFAHTAESGKWATFTWISKKSKAAQEEGPSEGRDDPQADADFL